MVTKYKLVDYDGIFLQPAEDGEYVCYCDYQAVQQHLQMAVWRLEDILMGDDGQAYQEAENFLTLLKTYDAHLLED